jgi:hypothetical protein
MTKYDHFRFTNEESTLVTPEGVDQSIENAKKDIEQYIQNADIYLKDLARHRRFVERNIEYEKLIKIERRDVDVNRWWRIDGTSAAQEYQITVSRIPILHDKPTLRWSANEETIYTANIPVRQMKTAMVRFLYELIWHEPRIVAIRDVNLTKLAYYAHKLPEFQNVSVRNYRLPDVIDVLCEGVPQNRSRCTIPLFDIDRI